MPTEKPRFTVILDEDVYLRLEEYWRMNNYKGRNQAVNDLIRAAMADEEQLTPDEQRLVSNYRKSEYLAKAMVHGALTSGLRYANAHISHRKAAVKPLDGSPIEPIAEFDADTLSYTEDTPDSKEVQRVIKEKLPGSSEELTGSEES